MDFMQGWQDYILKIDLTETKSSTFDQYVDSENKQADEPQTKSLATSEDFARSHQRNLIYRIARAIKSQQRVSNDPSLHAIYSITSELAKLNSKIQIELNNFRTNFQELFQDEELEPELMREELVNQDDFTKEFFEYIGSILIDSINTKTQAGLELIDVEFSNDENSDFNADELYGNILQESESDPIPSYDYIVVKIDGGKFNTEFKLTYPAESYMGYMVALNSSQKFPLADFSIGSGGQTRNDKDIKAAKWLAMNQEYPSKAWGALYQAALKQIKPSNEQETV